MCSENSEIFEAYQYLTQREKQNFRKYIFKGVERLSGKNVIKEFLSIDCVSEKNTGEYSLSEENYNELLNERFKSGDKGCPRCGSTYIVKNGRNSNNSQRYRCNDCRKVFSSATSTPLMYTKKSVQHWVDYMKCMIQGLSVRDSAKKVGIHRNTSFQWRHKILNSLKASLKSDLSGIVEIDESLINESFKGNHSKDEDFRMGRAPRKRGMKLSRCTSGSKVRVICCIDRAENIYSAVVGRIRPDWQRLVGMLKGKIAEGSTVCTNRSMSYITFAKKLNLKLYKLSNFTEVQEKIYHIQNARAFGRQLKSFIGDFHGVATKYLNFYITWLKWVNLSNKKISDYIVIDAFRLIASCGSRLRVCDFRLVSSMPRD